MVEARHADDTVAGPPFDVSEVAAARRGAHPRSRAQPRRIGRPVAAFFAGLPMGIVRMVRLNVHLDLSSPVPIVDGWYIAGAELSRPLGPNRVDTAK